MKKLHKSFLRTENNVRPFHFDAFWILLVKIITATLKMYAFDLYGQEISKYITWAAVRQICVKIESNLLFWF